MKAFFAMLARVRMAWVRWAVYACFFLSGSTSLIFEVLWSRHFVTVFGNSSYAISIVLCSYMAGLGLGGLLGGKLADRITRRMTAFGVAQVGVAVWALAIPLLLTRLRVLVPNLPALSPESLLVSTVARFALSFAILVVPCFLMGTTLPLLVRAVTGLDRLIGRRIGVLYCWNTLGAAFGCLAAGFWMLDTLGLRLTNLWAVALNILVALVAFALSKPLSSAHESEVSAVPPTESIPPAADLKSGEPAAALGVLLLGIAFLNGLASLACEVLWLRYLAFLGQEAYVFPTILCIYLLGLGSGALLYSLLAGRVRSELEALGIIEGLLAIAVLATLATGALIFAGGPPRPLELKAMTWITVFVPTVLMGMAFPLLCNMYGRHVTVLGGRIGVLFAVNTAGTVFGSLLPVFVLVPLLGIQRSLLLVSLLYGVTGLVLLVRVERNRPRLSPLIVVYALTLLLFLTIVPSNLCQRVLLATGFDLGKQTDILFYHEGRTGTASVVRDFANNRKTIFINGDSEVPVSYGHLICFKMLGDLGPMLHPNPDHALMICLGGGIAAGATACLPDVKSITIVDLESSVAAAAGQLASENNHVLQNPKAHLVIDDGRNYLLTAHRRWPVIISDSTHPKNSDSWVLYTREFYRLVRDHLTEDGVFVEWVPRHHLTTAEFKIIARTFQSVFHHASLWVTQGMDDQGQFITYGLLVGTPQPLRIDVGKLRDRLNAEPVRKDLEPYGLDSPAGFLDSFICAEDGLRRWTGDGPINTDDLPYTQYETRYSRGDPMDEAEFIEPMEDLWPCLTGTGSEESASRLHDELSSRAKATRLALLNHLAEALAALPEDVRSQRMLQLYEQGPQYVQTLLKLYWDNPQALVYLAGLRAAGPGASSSIPLIFERVRELDPNNVSALNMLGTFYLDTGNQMRAEEYFRRALRLAPDFAPVRCNLALVLQRTGRLTEALREWEKAAVGSNDAKAALAWGICLAHENRDSEAIQWFSRAVEIRPTLLRARFHLADLLYQAGRRQQALSQVDYALKLDPNNKAFLKLQAAFEGRDKARRQTELDQTDPTLSQ